MTLGDLLRLELRLGIGMSLRLDAVLMLVSLV
jgi:hypothetical protein